MFGLLSTTAMSSMRPPMFAGPIERHCKFFKTVSSTFACAKVTVGIASSTHKIK
jgi:hypothetical protein